MKADSKFLLKFTVIGRGGENIMKMQRETGCRIQITQSIPGTKERPCTLSGTQEQIE